MKKAVIVEFNIRTRVVIDVKGDEITESEQTAACDAAVSKVLGNNTRAYLVDGVVDVAEDDECPYGIFAGER